jgi:hypothetical protein
MCLQSCPNAIYSTHLGIEIDDLKSSIPDGYKTYALFINPSHEYNNKHLNDKIFILSKVFKNFGESIGEKNLAVWCGIIDDNLQKAHFNVSQSKYYADKFTLNYNEGPYVILTDVSPDSISGIFPKNGHVMILSFSNIHPDRIVTVLNEVEKRLRGGKGGIKITYYTQIAISRYRDYLDFVKEVLEILSPVLKKG